MALSATSFSTASMVTKVKMAMQQAMYVGQAPVYGRKGKLLMLVHYNPPGCSKPFQFYHERQGDVSALVVAGARRYHEGVQHA